MNNFKLHGMHKEVWLHTSTKFPQKFRVTISREIKSQSEV